MAGRASGARPTSRQSWPTCTRSRPVSAPEAIAPPFSPVHLHDLRWLSRIQRHDLVFNLLEGINGVACYEDWSVRRHGADRCAVHRCRFSAITLCHRKHVANTLLDKAGVPVPPFAIARKNELPAGLRLPVIVKPSAEDASVGIDAGSVCDTKKAVKERLALVSEQWSDVMVQEYVDGREFYVGFLGNHVLPLSEISFETLPEKYWRIVSYAAKWTETSPEYKGDRADHASESRSFARRQDYRGRAQGVADHWR
jgi:D-alanine-D-alanine ligase